MVEDEEVICHICRTVLEKEGFAVDIAANGRDAREMIDMNGYDLCLIDILTPEMSGRQLYQWLQKKHPQLTNKVVFCTGMAMEGNMQRFLEKSGRPVLLKPFSPDELVNIVQEALQG